MIEGSFLFLDFILDFQNLFWKSWFENLFVKIQSLGFELNISYPFVTSLVRIKQAPSIWLLNIYMNH